MLALLSQPCHNSFIVLNPLCSISPSICPSISTTIAPLLAHSPLLFRRSSCCLDGNLDFRSPLPSHARSLNLACDLNGYSSPSSSCTYLLLTSKIVRTFSSIFNPSTLRNLACDLGRFSSPPRSLHPAAPPQPCVSTNMIYPSSQEWSIHLAHPVTLAILPSLRPLPLSLLHLIRSSC